MLKEGTIQGALIDEVSHMGEGVLTGLRREEVGG